MGESGQKIQIFSYQSNKSWVIMYNMLNIVSLLHIWKVAKRVDFKISHHKIKKKKPSLSISYREDIMEIMVRILGWIKRVPALHSDRNACFYGILVLTLRENQFSVLSEVWC